MSMTERQDLVSWLSWLNFFLRQVVLRLMAVPHDTVQRLSFVLQLSVSAKEDEKDGMSALGHSYKLSQPLFSL